MCPADAKRANERYKFGKPEIVAVMEVGKLLIACDHLHFDAYYSPQLS
jgi:hypothetical protein